MAKLRWTQDSSRHRNRAHQPVAENLYSPGAFFFLGRQAPFATFDPDLVLRGFDVLLPVYEFVEFDPEGTPPALYKQRGFVFDPERSVADVRARATRAMRMAGVSQVSHRHEMLQER